MYSDDWKQDCLRWRGRVLVGKHGHWCPDWDELPIDETTDEWPCPCYASTPFAKDTRMSFHLPDHWSIVPPSESGDRFPIALRERYHERVIGPGMHPILATVKEMACWLVGPDGNAPASYEAAHLVVEGETGDDDVPLSVIYELAWQCGILPR